MREEESPGEISEKEAVDKVTLEAVYEFLGSPLGCASLDLKQHTQTVVTGPWYTDHYQNPRLVKDKYT